MAEVSKAAWRQANGISGGHGGWRRISAKYHRRNGSLNGMAYSRRKAQTAWLAKRRHQSLAIIISVAA